MPPSVSTINFLGRLSVIFRCFFFIFFHQFPIAFYFYQHRPRTTVAGAPSASQARTPRIRTAQGCSTLHLKLASVYFEPPIAPRSSPPCNHSKSYTAKVGFS
jgi:hypothetical protein